MSCETIRESMVDYYYRSELSLERRREIALHLGSCSSCALEYCRLEADLSGLHDLLELDEPRPEVKQALAQRIESEFGAGPAKKFARLLFGLLTRPLPAYQAALFASAVAFAFVFFIARRPPEHPPATSIAAHTVIDQVDATVVLGDPDLL